MGSSWRNAFASVRLMMVQEFHLSHHNTYLPVMPLRSIIDFLYPLKKEGTHPLIKEVSKYCIEEQDQAQSLNE